ncbi:PPE domain-containing protein [Mycobacterium avium]|uniref:PPE family protein, SVP subgroup n=1 Tax=Mycobacterium avium TaxID=1764 RepID=UPI0029397CFA|nr:PPE domain-containing protein [Mycobacterium avium]MDV3301819.1 PPE domain-containing protein [Mycobacterium avium]
MEFAALPPEVNSGRIYAGPGSGPMLAAAEAWQTLAAELHSASSSYASVVSGLTAGPWLGPSSAIMAEAADSYVAWMRSIATQAEQTSSQARTAAAAYETAFAATVPPPVVAANRSQLAALVATNLLGQNTPVIAATEAQYSEMWAQDAVAMYAYADSAAAATQLTPFSPSQRNTTSNGHANQAGAVSKAGEVATGPAQNIASNASGSLLSVPDTLSTATSALGISSPLDLLELGADGITYGIDAPLAPIGAISLPIDLVGAQTGLHTDDIVSGWNAAGTSPEAVVKSLMPSAPAATANMVSKAVSAQVGEADAVGALSVPRTWTVATPAVRPIALALPAAPVGIAQQALTPSLGSSLEEIPLAATAGLAIRDRLSARGHEPRDTNPAGTRAVSATAPRIGDEQTATQHEPRTVVTGIAAEIREFARLRDEGLISDEEYTAQRNRLLGQ